MMESIDEEDLIRAKILDKDTYKKKNIRTNTKMFYEQEKFNLYIENNEGYA